MTVANTEARKEHSGDGTTSSFTTNPVIFFDSSTLTVKVVTTATGGNVTLVENTDYTVSGGSGAVGDVDLSGGSSPYGAPAATEYVVIVRAEPYTQTDDFVNNSASDAEVVEQRYDKIVMQIQQLLEVTDRSIKLSDIETGTSANSTIPYDRNDKYLAFDSSGNFVAVDGTAAPQISSYWFTVVTAQTAAASQILLDLEPGVDVQAYDADLAAIAGLATTDGNFIVGNGSTWVAESGATARTSMGLGTTDNVQFASVTATTTQSNFNSGDQTVIAAGATTAAGSAAAGNIRVDTDNSEFRYSDASNWFIAKVAGRETMWLPAQSLVPNTTNGASLQDNESTTNDVMYKSMDYDQSTSESAQFSLMMPKSWAADGTFSFRPVWTAASGSGTATWGFAILALANDDAIDAAWSSTVSVTDTLLATGDVHLADETSTISISGTAAFDWVVIKCLRDVADTLTADAKLLGFHVYFDSNAKSDD